MVLCSNDGISAQLIAFVAIAMIPSHSLISPHFRIKHRDSYTILLFFKKTDIYIFFLIYIVIEKLTVKLKALFPSWYILVHRSSLNFIFIAQRELNDITSLGTETQRRGETSLQLQRKYNINLTELYKNKQQRHVINLLLIIFSICI